MEIIPEVVSEVTEKKKTKKKKVKKEISNLKNISIPKGISIESVDMVRAKFLCSLPKSLGINPENPERDLFKFRKIWSLFKM